MSKMQKWLSQFLKNLPSFFRASLRIRQTKSSFWKLIGFTFELYLIVAQTLHVSFLILFFSLNLLIMSRSANKLSLLKFKSWICHRREGYPISIRIIAFCPVSKVVWGFLCSRLWCTPVSPQDFEKLFSPLPLAGLSLFFNSLRMS